MTIFLSAASQEASRLRRARADRRVIIGPSFGPFDEFHGEDEGDGECDLSGSLPAEPVGVAAQLTRV